ncbi:MAG: hypothetical protein GF332_01865 [Candidatus Moranbacteria bacterium]|nr:hypothetical protein [Candidatus Moranbacteria bacterium]
MTLGRKIIILLIRLLIVIFALVVPVTAMIFSSFLVVKTYEVSQSISYASYFDNLKSEFQNQNYEQKSTTKQIFSQALQAVGTETPRLKYGTDERVNILLLGKASQDYPGSNLTDTIILASYNPTTNQSALLSIPRDLYVKLPDSEQYTKLNYVYHYGQTRDGNRGGIKYLSKVIKRITDQDVNYFILIDFQGFEKLVDELGGIDVTVEQPISDHRYPGPNFSYQHFELDAGQQHLNGATALKYVRTRHDPNGDFGRSKRQQQVLAALKKRFFSLGSISLMSKLNSILAIVEQNIQTDIDLSEYGSFLAIAKNINIDQTATKVLDNRGSDPVLTSYSPRINRTRAYFLKPKDGNYFRIHQIAANIFDLDKLAKLDAKRQKENPSILIINRSDDPEAGIDFKQELKKTSLGQINLDSNQYSPKALTQIFDNTKGLKPYSLNTVVTSLNQKVKPYPHPDHKNHDFIIVLGQDYLDQEPEQEIVLPQQAFEQY